MLIITKDKSEMIKQMVLLGVNSVVFVITQENLTEIFNDVLKKTLFVCEGDKVFLYDCTNRKLFVDVEAFEKINLLENRGSILVDINDLSKGGCLKLEGELLDELSFYEGDKK